MEKRFPPTFFLSSLRAFGAPFQGVSGRFNASQQVSEKSQEEFACPGVSKIAVRSTQDRCSPFGENEDMRRTSPHIRDRQERALVLALSGMPVSKIAQCLGYSTTSGAWKALRSAAARKTDSTPKHIQSRLRDADQAHRMNCHARALQDVVVQSGN